MYAGVTRTTLDLLACRTVNGVSRNFYAPQAECFSGYGGWEYPTFALLLTFAAPFPFMIAVNLYRTRKWQATPQARRMSITGVGDLDSLAQSASGAWSVLYFR